MYRRSWSMEDRVGRAGSVEVGDGTSIAWRVLGSGNLPGLLVVHGGATSSADYEAAAACSLRPGPCSSWTVGVAVSVGPWATQPAAYSRW